MTQISFQDFSDNYDRSYLVETFSADHFADDSERKKIEALYAPILKITSKFNRQNVSFQLSKKDALHSWLKYKEGFSANLVQILLDEMNVVSGDTIMDPFMGSGTTALVCQMRGINCIGYDVLPISGVSISAKTAVMHYDANQIIDLVNQFSSLNLPEDYNKKTPFISITKSAYPEYNEKFIQYATDWITSMQYSTDIKNLFTLCVINSLERSSYTTKSGQYLGWDYRSNKVITENNRRLQSGKKPLTEVKCREEIFNVKNEILNELNNVLNDIIMIQSQNLKNQNSTVTYKQSSVLYELPLLDADILSGVITSPPYCNRYDYTRTYALELVYLGLNETTIKEMRQSLLSCTVESKQKTSALRQFYQEHGLLDRYDYIYKVITTNKAFIEILNALNLRKNNGEINNSGIIRMVEGYFTELAFIYAELYRICKKGSLVAFVNDNVRYGGEVIPVDFLSTNLAEQIGFTPVTTYCLKQQKGNSSQQMKKYGRVALRKSITIWRKD